MLASKHVASGFINDTEIRFIEKTDSSDPTRCEDFWIDSLKTCCPQGLNNLHFQKLLMYLRKMFVFSFRIGLFNSIYFLRVYP